MRLFIGIPLPQEVRERLAGLSGGLPGAKWIAPDNLHLTLRFLGEVDGAQATDLDAALSWYEKAADLGHVGAMLALAEAHRIGDLGLAPDPQRARAWDDKARRARGGD